MDRGLPVVAQSVTGVSPRREIVSGIVGLHGGQWVQFPTWAFWGKIMIIDELKTPHSEREAG